MRRGVFVKLVFFALALCIILAGYLWQQVKVTQLSKDISKLSSRREDLIRENQRLQAQVSYLSRYERIKGIAKRKLNMKLPSSPPVLVKID